MKIINLFIACAFLFVISSCDKDESSDRTPNLVPGQFVTMSVVGIGIIDATKLDTSSFEAIIDAPAKNVDKYELFVAVRDGTGIVSDFVLLETVTSLPHALKVSSASIEAAGLPALKKADNIRFFGRSYSNGNVVDYNNLGSILKTSIAQKQGYRFQTTVRDNPIEPLDNSYTW